MRSEWKVEYSGDSGRGFAWVEAKDSDDACDKYRERYALPESALDEMTGTDVRTIEER